MPAAPTLQEKRRATHALDAAGKDQIGLTEAYLLSSKFNALESAAADLVDGKGRPGIGDPGGNGDLAGDVHTLAGRQDAAEDRLLDGGGIDAGRGHSLAGQLLAEIDGGQVAETAQEAADGGAFGKDDYRLTGHLLLHFQESSAGGGEFVQTFGVCQGGAVVGGIATQDPGNSGLGDLAVVGARDIGHRQYVARNMSG